MKISNYALAAGIRIIQCCQSMYSELQCNKSSVVRTLTAHFCLMGVLPQKLDHMWIHLWSILFILLQYRALDINL